MPYSWISWRLFLKGGSFLCDNSSLCQVDTQNQPVYQPSHKISNLTSSCLQDVVLKCTGSLLLHFLAEVPLLLPQALSHSKLGETCCFQLPLHFPSEALLSPTPAFPLLAANSGHFPFPGHSRRTQGATGATSKTNDKNSPTSVVPRLALSQITRCSCCLSLEVGFHA